MYQTSVPKSSSSLPPIPTDEATNITQVKNSPSDYLKSESLSSSQGRLPHQSAENTNQVAANATRMMANAEEPNNDSTPPPLPPRLPQKSDIPKPPLAPGSVVHNQYVSPTPSGIPPPLIPRPPPMPSMQLNEPSTWESPLEKDGLMQNTSPGEISKLSVISESSTTPSEIPPPMIPHPPPMPRMQLNEPSIWESPLEKDGFMQNTFSCKIPKLSEISESAREEYVRNWVMTDMSIERSVEDVEFAIQALRAVNLIDVELAEQSVKKPSLLLASSAKFTPLFL